MLPQFNNNIKDWLSDVEARSNRNSLAAKEDLGDSAPSKMSGKSFRRQQLCRLVRYKEGH